MYRRPIPRPGPEDQWVVVRGRDWGEAVRVYPGKDVAALIPLKLLDLERDGRAIPGVSDAAAVHSTGFTVWSASLNEVGILAISGTAWLDIDKGLSLIVLYQVSSGRMLRAISPWPVSCRAAEADAEDGVWCLGSDVAALRKSEAPGDVLHRYSLAGKALWHGIKAGGFARGGGPVLQQHRGDARVFLTKSGGLILCLPALDLIVFADHKGQELRRHTPAMRKLAVTYTLALSPEGKLLALLPQCFDCTNSTRYRLYELDSGTDGAAREPSSTLGWVQAGADRDFAGHSTELVGLDGPQPVIWDRSGGAVLWLEPLR
ncbi:MAG: hypothetical protein HY821_23645 [Acidobacteria bacterium]|nr:hypothetical protein [Acidobacteriota bacterium]